MKVLSLFLSILLLAGCATSPRDVPSPQELASDRGYALGEEVKSIHDYEVNGWQYVSNRALIIPARPSNHYLLILNRPCPDLNATEVIGFTTTVDSVLSRFDAVVVRSHPRSIEQRCHIDHMYRITKIPRDKAEQ